VPSENLHNEKELLSRVANGERNAFTPLYNHYFPIVNRYVSLFEPSGNYLDELTQDVFVRIWDKREKLAEVDSFKGYLFLVTRNLVFNYLRARRVQKKHTGLESSADAVAGDDMENDILFRQYYKIVMEAIGKLSIGRRKILKMSIEQGLTLDEIADELGISRSGVKKQLYAATSFVRDYLREHGELSVLLFVFLSLFEV
jgi:RNA polymerase sigma-70 factor (ECF subfamily)